MTIRECRNCEFYERHHELRERGKCHRYPPTTLNGVGWSWPFMRFNQWCGEFKSVIGNPYEKEQPKFEDTHSPYCECDKCWGVIAE